MIHLVSFNVAHYLVELLYSSINQTKRALSVIIGDDSLSDNVVEIINESIKRFQDIFDKS